MTRLDTSVLAVAAGERLFLGAVLLLVRAALDDYRGAGGDFSDYVIGHRAREAGCDRTATFDRRLKANALFRVLPA